MFKGCEMSVDPVEAIGPVDTYTTYFAIPLQSATGTSHIARTEQLDVNGRTMSVAEVVLLLYDRFANLETIPSQRDLSTINMTV